MDLEQGPFRIMHRSIRNVYHKILIVISFCPKRLGCFFPSLLVCVDVKHFQIDKSAIWIYYFKDYCLIFIGVPHISISTVIMMPWQRPLAVSRICSISVVL